MEPVQVLGRGIIVFPLEIPMWQELTQQDTGKGEWCQERDKKFIRMIVEAFEGAWGLDAENVWKKSSNQPKL